MDEVPSPQDVQSELSALRARAYGPHADIEDDPEAMVRLAELERERLPHAGAADETAASSEHAGTPALPGADDADEVATSPLRVRAEVAPARRTRVMFSTLGWVFGAALAAVLVVASAFAGFTAPRPDVTLRPSGVEPDDQVAWRFVPDGSIDESTLRGYASYRGLEPWVADIGGGGRCLLVAERSVRGPQGVSCVPAGADPVVELGVWPEEGSGFGVGLREGSVIRFRVYGDVIHVFVYPAPGGD